MVFVTGAKGYNPSMLGTLNFLDAEEAKYPTASTCTMSLTLPTQYTDYSTFKQKCLFAFSNKTGFGLF